MTMPGVFVTGTDTGVGKTWVVSRILKELIASGRHPGAMKPIASSAILQDDGTLVSPDGLAIQAALGGFPPLDRIVPYTLSGEVAPSVALREMGQTLSGSQLLATTQICLDWWADRADCVVIEGVGGFLCPLTDDSTIADVAIGLDYPLVIVAKRGLGTINHTLLTVEAAKVRGLRIAGVIMNAADSSQNDASSQTNADELARRLKGVPILAEWPYQAELEALPGGILIVDWYGLCRSARHGA